MTYHQSALPTLIQELLDDPDAARDELFRRLLQAGMQDLVDAEAAVKIGAGRYAQRASWRPGGGSADLLAVTWLLHQLDR